MHVDQVRDQPRIDPPPHALHQTREERERRQSELDAPTVRDRAPPPRIAVEPNDIRAAEKVQIAKREHERAKLVSAGQNVSRQRAAAHTHIHRAAHPIQKSAN